MKLFLRNQLCIPVSGYNRAMIYDLGRNDYHLISNEHYQILNTDGIINFDGISDEIERNELIDFLLELEIIFEVASPQGAKRFPKISRDLNDLFQLTHAVIHANISPIFFDFIKNNNLQNLSIIAHEINHKLLKLMASIAHLEVDGIYLYIENFNAEKLEEYYLELSQYYALFSVNFFGSKQSDTVLRDNVYYNFFTEKFANYQQKLTVDKLSVNQALFLEAYNKHSYYHGKIYIDQSGNIKNGLNNVQQFGNINAMNYEAFQEIIHSQLFLALGNINKNETLVCQDCEFRYMCIDARVPQKGNGLWYHLQECQYNPYVSKWQNEEDYIDLAAAGVFVSATGRVIDKAQLNRKFNQLWSE